MKFDRNILKLIHEFFLTISDYDFEASLKEQLQPKLISLKS